MTTSINGFGRTYYGQRDFEPDGSFITTKWLIMAFFPIAPSGSARVRVTDSGGIFFKELEVLEELPTCWRQALYTYAYAYGLIPMAIHYSDKFHWKTPTQVVVGLLIAALPYALRFFARSRS